MATEDLPTWTCSLEIAPGERLTGVVYRRHRNGFYDYAISWRATWWDEKAKAWKPKRQTFATHLALPQLHRKITRWVLRDQRKLAAKRTEYEEGKMPLNENQMAVIREYEKRKKKKTG